MLISDKYGDDRRTSIGFDEYDIVHGRSDSERKYGDLP